MPKRTHDDLLSDEEIYSSESFSSDDEEPEPKSRQLALNRPRKNSSIQNIFLQFLATVPRRFLPYSDFKQQLQALPSEIAMEIIDNLQTVAAFGFNCVHSPLSGQLKSLHLSSKYQQSGPLHQFTLEAIGIGHELCALRELDIGYWFGSSNSWMDILCFIPILKCKSLEKVVFRHGNWAIQFVEEQGVLQSCFEKEYLWALLEARHAPYAF